MPLGVPPRSGPAAGLLIAIGYVGDAVVGSGSAGPSVRFVMLNKPPWPAAESNLIDAPQNGSPAPVVAHRDTVMLPAPGVNDADVGPPQTEPLDSEKVVAACAGASTRPRESPPTAIAARLSRYANFIDLFPNTS